MNYPDHLLKLIAIFKKLPGVGSRSAERFAFHLLEWPEEKLAEMGKIIEATKKNLIHCAECFCLMEAHCPFCSHTSRNSDLLCIVATPKDVFSIEQTHEFNGLYHVLGGLFSPLQGVAPHPESLAKLKERIEFLKIKEIILALDSTLEGDATALYLKKELAHTPLKISRPALGLPMGSSFDFIDGGTLSHALAGRQSF